MRRAKIGGTLGPACDDAGVLARMVGHGLDLARINFSHGEAAAHARRAARLRRVCRKAGRTVALLGDLQGPRFRLGRLPGGSLDLETGGRVDVIAGSSTSRAGTLPVPWAPLARDVKPGHAILIDDGNVALRVERIRGERVSCRIERGGRVSDRKGLNLPGSALSAPALTAKDRVDLEHAVRIGCDWLLVSFVRRAADLRLARRLLERAGRVLPGMATIERPEALDRLDESLEAADGILVARGDLGVELPPERVPVLQKSILAKARAAGKPAMIATQMLQSMMVATRPTRAEASDVANAVLDGADSLLLTAETAAGANPEAAVAMMERIVVEAESIATNPPPPDAPRSVAEATCHAACAAARDVGARVIVAFTQSGFTARSVARFRPETPILAYTPDPAVARALVAVWGVVARVLPAQTTTDAMLRALDRALVKDRLARRGETVIVISGVPIGVSGRTNLMKVHRVGIR